MDSDRELLEMAAKAAGYETDHPLNHERLYHEVLDLCIGLNGDLVSTGWNPLADDGDALRLAVRLQLDVDHNQDLACVYGHLVAIEVENGNDPYAATRRAIVRAAAEIGKTL